MKPIAKLSPSAFCRSIARDLGVLALGCSLLGVAKTTQAQIANTPTAGLDDIKIGLRSEKHQVGVSADYLIGYGQLSLPFGFAIAKSPLNLPVQPSVDLKDRDSTYYGGTLSYSYGQAWFFDFSYSQGTSSAETAKNLFGVPFPTVEYKIDDNWYQFYVRYAFPQLRGKRFSAYMRVGGTYVDAALSARGQNAGFGYEQDTSIQDIEGNVGIGVGYSIFSSSKVRLSAIGEAEGFAGTRAQKMEERLAQGAVPAPGSPFQDRLDNMVYGGLGRASLRFEFFPGQSRRLRLFADAGVQFRYTMIEYEQSPGAPSFDARSFGETLWGPFVKLGVRYSF